MNVQQLQRLAGNAAVSRLIGSRPQQTGGGSPPGGIANSASGASSTPGAARSAFLKLAAEAVAARDVSARRGESAQRQNEAATGLSGRTADRKDVTAQSQAAVRDAKANGAAPQPDSAPRPPAVRAPAEVADKIAPDQAPAAVAQQAAALRAPAGALAVPLEEARGRGQESERALGELSGYADSHPGLVGLGTAISERIGGLRERAVANAEQHSAELRGSANNERGVVQDAVRTNHDAVKGTIRTTKAQLEQATGAGHGRVEAQADAARARSDAISAGETERVATTVGTGRQQARQIFGDARGHIGEVGDTERTRVQTHAHQQADHVLELGRQQAQQERRTEEDTDLAADKADAVMEVAHDYAGRLREDGTELAASLPKQASEANEQVSSEEVPTVEGLGQTADSATEGIRGLMNSVRLGVNSIALQGHQQLGAAQTSLSDEVENLEQAAAGRAEALRAEGLAAVDAGLAAGVVAQAKIAGQAGQLLDEAGRDAIAVLVDNAAAANAVGPVVARQRAPGSPAGTASSAPHGPGAPGGAALAQLDQVGPGLDAAASTQQGELVQSLSQAGVGAEQAGLAWHAEIGDVTGRLGQTASVGLNQVADGAGAQADATLTEGSTRAAGEVDRVASDVDSTVGDLRGQVATGTGQAVDSLHDGADAGIRQANDQVAEVPGAMRDAADAQDSWLGRLGNWASNQLSDVWRAVKGMADWRFVLSLAAGIGAALLVAGGVALLIASAPFTLPGLAVVLIVGAAAGAAGFTAAQITGNLLDPNPNRHWYDGVGHAAILGTFVGAGGAAAVFFGLTLATGTLVVMGSAGVGTVVANVATGRDWDEHLLANVLIIGVFHAILKGVTDRMPNRGTTHDPTDTRDPGQTEPHRPPARGAVPEIEIDDPARLQATEFTRVGDKYEAALIDQQTGARYGEAEVEIDASGQPKGGPRLTIDPARSTMPDRSPVRLKARGFGWTEESLRAAIDGFRRKFGRGPADMGGELWWKNLINFQTMFAKIRAANPGLSEGVVAERAARSISFGKHRIAIGYGDISVQYGNMGDVTLDTGEVLTNVPRSVEVMAKPTSGTPIPAVPDRSDDNDD